MLRRLALVIPTLLGVTALVFAFLHLVPGDPVEIMLGESAMPADVEAMRRDLGLDRSLPAQLAAYLGNALRGDLGHSLAFHAPVVTVIAERYPATLELAAAAFVVALVIALPLGIVAALRPGRAVDRVVRVLSLGGICVPTVCLGPLLILVFSVWLAWLPVSGRGGVAHLVLPAFTLGLGMAGMLVRLTRASMLGALGEDFVQAARAKGASDARVALRHALPVALPPIVTALGLQAGALLAGAVVTETVFAWPGVGRLVVQAIGARDYALVQGCVLAIGGTYVLVNAATDVLVARLDPRMREAGYDA
jgi:peptide/nickel transport system permease protein